MKNSGLDALVVLGRAEEPVYLHVEGGQVAIHAAPHLWGKDPLEVEGLLKEAHGPTTRIAQIGIAGENGVFTANIIHDLAHFAGRGGLGAVMGPRASRRSPPRLGRTPGPSTTTRPSLRPWPGA